MKAAKLEGERLAPEGQVIAGVDEAGRGSLAGPVVAAAVVLTRTAVLPPVDDSKRMTARQRRVAADAIRRSCMWCIARAEPEEIDRMNILRASLLAMQRAVMGLPTFPSRVLVDGIHAPALGCETVTVVKGDQLHPCISAASIVAKVYRDEELTKLACKFSQYGFERNKGYPTPEHLAAIEVHGPSPVHRRSFGPVRRCERRMDKLVEERAHA